VVHYEFSSGNVETAIPIRGYLPPPLFLSSFVPVSKYAPTLAGKMRNNWTASINVCVGVERWILKGCDNTGLSMWTEFGWLWIRFSGEMWGKVSRSFGLLSNRIFLNTTPGLCIVLIKDICLHRLKRVIMKNLESGLPVACLKTELGIVQIKLWHVICSVYEFMVLLQR
jgi:hypothetical protein